MVHYRYILDFLLYTNMLAGGTTGPKNPWGKVL